MTKYSMKWSEVTQSCLTLCDPMDSSLPGSFVHGIFQARVLEWGAISFSRGSSQPRDRTQALQADTLLSEPPHWRQILREAQILYGILLFCSIFQGKVRTVWKMWYQILSLSLSQFTSYLWWYLESSSKWKYQGSFFVCVWHWHLKCPSSAPIFDWYFVSM